MTIAGSCAVFAVALAAALYAALDLAKIGARAVDRRRVRRACRRGWDWTAFEREVAGYERERGLQR